MKFKVDEDLPSEIADLLRNAGHDAETVRGEGLGGRSDEEVARVCQAEDRVLVTLDVGFADVRAYPPEQHAGLMVLRLVRQDEPHVLSVLRSALPLLEGEALRGRLWIVEDGKVRIRQGCRAAVPCNMG